MLPLPRLVLRLGVLVDPEFTSPEAPANSKTEVLWHRDTLRLLAQVGRFVEIIHRQDQTIKWSRLRPQLANSTWSRYWTFPLRLLFFNRDRWGWKNKGSDTKASVFSEAAPLCQFVAGGDEVALVDGLRKSLDDERPPAQPGDEASEVIYKTLGIRLEVPSAEKEGQGDLCIGEVPQVDDPVRAERLAHYGKRAVLHAVRHHSDVLLAVWHTASGDQAGGPSETMAAALEERIPVLVVYVDRSNRTEIRVLQTSEDLRALQKEVASSSGARPDLNWKVDLENVLGSLLKFPDPPQHEPDSSNKPEAPHASQDPDPDPDPVFGKDADEHEGHSHEHRTWYHPRGAFLELLAPQNPRYIWTAWLWAGIEKMVKPSTERRKIGFGERIRWAIGVFVAPWIALFNGLLKLDREDACKPLPDNSEFQRHYGWVKDRADSGYGKVFADAHRGGIVFSYVVAVHAVILALLGAIAHHHHWHLFAIIVAFSEVACIILLWALSALAKREDWHEAYVESRILAEALRAMEFLGPLGVHSPLPRLPHYLRGDSSTPAPEQMWSLWYFRALVRMAPFRIAPSSSPDNGAFPPGCHSLGPSHAEYLVAERDRLDLGWIKDQYNHHKANRIKQDRIHSGIEIFSFILFCMVLGCAVAHLVDLFIPKDYKFLSHDLSLLVCAGAPALIAALHGFGSQIETARLRQRSSSMCKLLKVRKSAHHDVDLSEPHGVEANWGFACEALITASVMMDETGSWSMLYKNTDIHNG